MRHSDSSPSIPPRFVAFVRRYHPSTCGFAPSDARCCVHGLGLGEPVPAPRRSLRWRRRGLPGSRETHPHACHALRPRRDSLPSNARRRPSQTMHFGAQSRGLRAPCERFAPWVTPGPRITRFRLAADLGRMGLDTHRVSNKVSKITSRHLVPLDRAFPAHALLHESELARNDPHPEAPHLPISYDSGPPRSVIRFRMLHASSASALCPPGVRARRPVPMIDLYLKKAFSTRACRW